MKKYSLLVLLYLIILTLITSCGGGGGGGGSPVATTGTTSVTSTTASTTPTVPVASGTATINAFSYTVQDLSGNTIFPETVYASDIDLTAETLQISLLANQIGWEDQNGTVYKLNAVAPGCTGNKTFKPSCYKTVPDEPGDIRLADGKFVTAAQIAVLHTQLAAPVSVVITFEVNDIPCKLEMALEFQQCNFWTDDSIANQWYVQDGNRFGDSFPQELYDLYDYSTFVDDGRIIYQTWCNNVADGNTAKYPAFYFAENCTKGGFTDWYLPSWSEIDGYEVVSNFPAIAKSLRACGFDYLFTDDIDILNYLVGGSIMKFPVFWFFRIGLGKCLTDVFNLDGIAHTPSYACAVRRF